MFHPSTSNAAAPVTARGAAAFKGRGSGTRAIVWGMPRRPLLFILTAGLAAAFAVGAGIARDAPTLLLLTAMALVNGFVCGRYAA